MSIPKWLFCSFWAIISFIFLKLGFNSLDRTNLSDSVSPVVMFLFKHLLAISVCHSSHYAFVFRPGLEIDIIRHFFWVLAAFDPIILLTTQIIGAWYFIYCALINIWAAFDKQRSVSAVLTDKIGLEIDFLIKLSMYCIEDNTKFYPTWILAISICTSRMWAAVFDEEQLLEVAMRKENPIIWHEGESSVEHELAIICAIFFQKENSPWFKKMLYERRKLIHYGIGMVGTILFQHFFRLTSFDHVLAFLYLAVSWLGNIALLGAQDDLGIMDFLLGNVIVGCTVNQFGLRRPTWIAFGASLVLYGVRLKLQSMSLANRGYEEVGSIV